MDILSFINPKKTANERDRAESDLFSSEIGPIDSESILLLEKLVHFVDKDELFNLLATKPLKSKTSKKAVRLMVIPNASTTSKEQPLAFRKKKYIILNSAIFEKKYRSCAGTTTTSKSRDVY